MSPSYLLLHKFHITGIHYLYELMYTMEFILLTFKNKGSFSDATGAMKDKRLRHAVVLHVIVEHGFQQGSGDDSPWLSAHH